MARKKGRQAPAGDKVYGASPIKPARRRRTRAEMQRIADALYELVRDSQPCTVRQAFYLAVSTGLVGKTEQEYKNTVGRLLLRMRQAGRIPFRWIADNTRWIRKPRSHDGIEDALEQTASLYRRDLWANQDVAVEVWCEKDAIAGVLY